MLRLKDRPLALQIWIILGIILGISAVLLTVSFPLALKHSFTSETYARIRESQQYIINNGDISGLPGENNWYDNLPHQSGKRSDNSPPSFRIVRHILADRNGQINEGGRGVPHEILQLMQMRAKEQRQELKHYSGTFDNNVILYVIQQVRIADKEGYLISYLSGRYRDNLVRTTFRRLIIILFFILFISWIASIFITRYLTRPLVELQSRVKEIALRNWGESVSLDRSDEIGELGETIEWMRSQLVEHDQKQQSFLQQVSHELKTPIMVIRSYAQSINDGIFPQGDLSSSVKVIEEETERLEKRVRSLLDLTRFDYLSTHQLAKEVFNLTELLKKVLDNFIWYSSGITWEDSLEVIKLEGDRDKIKIVLENILDNQIRYARKRIRLELYDAKDEDNSIILKFWNDGPEIEEDIIESLFQKYSRGNRGDFGLGLAIVKLIVEMHQGFVWASNEDSGVAFYIKLKQ